MINRKEIIILINEVIANTVARLKTEEFIPFKKRDINKAMSITLGKVVKRFNPKAKTVSVYIERVYENRKQDYFTTVTVEIDKKAELFTPITFTNYILAKL